jgi:hypothetical protein
MKGFTVLGMAALLLLLFFQCCPSAAPEAPPIQAPTEQVAPAPSQPPPEETTAPPPPAEATPTPAPQPVVLEFSGYGDEATELFRLDSGLIRCSYRHDGESNFIVYLLDDEGDAVALLANEIGACDGSSADSIRSAGDYLLSVTGDGNWSFVCEATGPAEQAAARQPSVVLELSGLGDEASQLFHLDSGLLRCGYTHDGESNFIVYLLDEQGESVALLANEIGGCEGSSGSGVGAAGNYLLDVTGDGNWTITLSQ